MASSKPDNLTHIVQPSYHPGVLRQYRECLSPEFYFTACNRLNGIVSSQFFVYEVCQFDGSSGIEKFKIVLAVKTITVQLSLRSTE